MKKTVPVTPLGLPCPVYIIATYNEDGTVDAMNAGWTGTCGAKPFSIMVALNTGRRTRENVLRTGKFTVCIGGKSLMDVSDYFGCISGAKEDKIKGAGVHVSKGEVLETPIIDEYPINLECEVSFTKEIGPHLMVVGEVKNMIVDDEILGEDGKVVLEKLQPIALDSITMRYIECDKVIGKAHGEGEKFVQSK